MKRLLLAASVALALAGCNDQFASSGRSLTPIPPQTVALMSEKGMTKTDPILVRLYKKESELEVWKRGVDGQYAKLKTYPICRWSGQLGPKKKEGDRQAPEGFYTVTPGLMNPNSSYYLSFDTGYPNAFDRANDRTGSALMVHGSCSSRGCFAMTDEGIAEVYALAREAFAGGQRGFELQSLPFRMTADNLARFRNDPNMPFWRNLKEGTDAFEITKRESKVAVCNGRYAFNGVGAGGCAPDPTLAPALAERDAEDRHAVAELVAKGTPAIRLVYADGGGHESFRAAQGLGGSTDSGFAVLDARPSRNLGDVSRPESLAQGPQEIPMDEPGARRPALLAAVKPAGRTPAAARPEPAPTVVASAAAAKPAETAERPFYERMLGGVLGRSEPPAASVVETAAPVAAPSPIPPRRQSAVTTPRAASKPQAAAPASQRQVDATAGSRGTRLAAVAD